MPSSGTKNAWVQTYTGRKWILLEPHPDRVNALDIAWALSMQCRYNGHCREFYSVAEHSVRASWIVPEEFRFWALMHDAAEAYLGDVVKPLKMLPGIRETYERMERETMTAIAERYGFDLPEPEQVRHADLVMLATEQRDLLPDPPDSWGRLPDPLPETIEPWTQVKAFERFVAAFIDLKPRP